MPDKRPGRSSEVLHDLGLAIGFGGSLMGAVGLGGARATTQTKHQRSQLIFAGWARWSPVATSAALAYTAGSAIDWRARRYAMGDRAWYAEIALVAAAASLTGYGALAGSNIAADAELPYSNTGHVPAYTDSELTAVKARLHAVQWLIPLLTGAAIVVSASTRSGRGRPRRTRSGPRRR